MPASATFLDRKVPRHPVHVVLDLTSKRLKASREELFDALQGELSASHRFVFAELMSYIEEIEARLTHVRRSTVDYEVLSVACNTPRWIKSLNLFGVLPPLLYTDLDPQGFGQPSSA